MGAWSFLTSHWSKSRWHKAQLIGFALLLCILLFETLFFAGIWYTSLQSGLTVYVEPATERVITQGEEHYNVTFLVGLTNSPFCEATCTYTITDQRSTQRTQGVLEHLTATPQPITATLSAPQVREYQSTAQISVTCENHERARCQRPHDNAIQTHSIRVDHYRSPEQQEAFHSVSEEWSATTQALSEYLSRLLGVLYLEDERIDREQVFYDVDIIERHISALRSAVASDDFILAALLTTIRSPSSLAHYSELVQQERAAVAAYQQLLRVKEQHDEYLVLLTEEDTQLLSELYTNASQAHAQFFTQSPAHALEAFVAVNITVEPALEHAQQLQQALHAQEMQECTEQNTTCPQPPPPVTNVDQGREVFTLVCQHINHSLCENLDRTLPPLAPTLNATLPEQPLIYTPVDIALPQTQCCSLGRCVACSQHTRIPILFVHGHSFAERTAPEYSLQAFSRMALALQDEGIFHAGPVFGRQQVTHGLFSHAPGGVSFVTTYYFDGYAEQGEVRFVTRKTERIETYAIRLRESVRNVQALTGHDEVVLVAHSMGGLVVRSYLEIFGEEDIAGVVMIGTPNNGIPRLIERLCPIIGADFECDDMRAGSLYLRRLAQAPTPSIPVLTIAGVGCDGDFDGIVEAESVFLSYAENVMVEGSCPGVDQLLHNHMLNPARYPEVFDLVVRFLEEI